MEPCVVRPLELTPPTDTVVPHVLKLVDLCARRLGDPIMWDRPISLMVVTVDGHYRGVYAPMDDPLLALKRIFPTPADVWPAFRSTDVNDLVHKVGSTAADDDDKELIPYCHEEWIGSLALQLIYGSGEIIYQGSVWSPKLDLYLYTRVAVALKHDVSWCTPLFEPRHLMSNAEWARLLVEMKQCIFHAATHPRVFTSIEVRAGDYLGGEDHGALKEYWKGCRVTFHGLAEMLIMAMVSFGFQAYLFGTDHVFCRYQDATPEDTFCAKFFTNNEDDGMAIAYTNQPDKAMHKDVIALCAKLLVKAYHHHHYNQQQQQQQQQHSAEASNKPWLVRIACTAHLVQENPKVQKPPIAFGIRIDTSLYY